MQYDTILFEQFRAEFLNLGLMYILSDIFKFSNFRNTELRLDLLYPTFITTSYTELNKEKVYLVCFQFSTHLAPASSVFSSMYSLV